MRAPTYYFQPIFLDKLYKNNKNWTERVVGCPTVGPTLDPPILKHDVKHDLFNFYDFDPYIAIATQT